MTTADPVDWKTRALAAEARETTLRDALEKAADTFRDTARALDMLHHSIIATAMLVAETATREILAATSTTQPSPASTIGGGPTPHSAVAVQKAVDMLRVIRLEHYWCVVGKDGGDRCQRCMAIDDIVANIDATNKADTK